MAGRGRTPSGRPPQRKGPNATPKVVVLRPQEDGDVDIPDLIRRPDGSAWHEMTTWWWDDVWRSPMAIEYTEPDVHGLYRMAVIVDDYWNATTTTSKIQLLSEIRLQSATFGLSPSDRSRLRWEIEKGEQAGKRTQQRREAEAPVPAPAPAADPRASFRSV
jgi:hypothetical protein